MSAATGARLVPLSAIGDVNRLQTLVRRVFGDGDRPAGWFGRKLRRECVDPALSVVATREDRPPTDPQAWLGYVLVGRPPSLAPAARTAGTGVVPAARGQGLGTRLLDVAAEAARGAGHTQLQLHAEASRADFYTTRQFEPLYPTVTALHFGAGPPTPPPRADDTLPETPTDDRATLISWLPSAWAQTEAADRHRLSIGTVDAWISREGRAWLVQRLDAPCSIGLATAAHSIREHLPADDPIVLSATPRDTPGMDTLLDSGWIAAQSGVLMARRL